MPDNYPARKPGIALLISMSARLCSSGSSIADLLAFRDHFQSRDALKMFSIVSNKRHSINDRRRCDPGVGRGHRTFFDRRNLRPLPADRVVGVDDWKLCCQESLHLISFFLSPIGKPHTSFYFGAGHKRDEQSTLAQILPISDA